MSHSLQHPAPFLVAENAVQCVVDAIDDARLHFVANAGFAKPATRDEIASPPLRTDAVRESLAQRLQPAVHDGPRDTRLGADPVKFDLLLVNLACGR